MTGILKATTPAYSDSAFVVHVFLHRRPSAPITVMHLPRWSAIATHLPKRTDNEIKNYWNTHLKKRLAKMGIDPVTHKAINGTLTGTTDDHSAKAAASLSHMAQWESARLEAEARLAREAKLRAATSAPTTLQPANPSATAASPCLDVLRAWQGAKIDLESPTSTLTFTGSNNGMLPTSRTTGIELSESNSAMWNTRSDELDGEDSEWKFLGKQQMQGLDGKDREEDFIGCEEPWFTGMAGVGAGFTGMLLDGSNVHDTSECWGESNNGQAERGSQVAGDEENKNYWNGILGMVNSELPSQPPPLL